jgi:Helix-turn-helix domain
MPSGFMSLHQTLRMQPMMSISPDELVSPAQAAVHLHIKPETLTAWRHRGIGPPYLKVGRQVFYRRADLSEWLGAQRRQPSARAS